MRRSGLHRRERHWKASARFAVVTARHFGLAARLTFETARSIDVGMLQYALSGEQPPNSRVQHHAIFAILAL